MNEEEAESVGTSVAATLSKAMNGVTEYLQFKSLIRLCPGFEMWHRMGRVFDC
jgi:hypothetical protein